MMHDEIEIDVHGSRIELVSPAPSSPTTMRGLYRVTLSRKELKRLLGESKASFVVAPPGFGAIEREGASS